jgi:choline dehydrogenase
MNRINTISAHFQPPSTGITNNTSSHQIPITPNQTSSSSSTRPTLYHPPSSPLKREYDYIIVGGGSAGCPLTARLAEGLCTSNNSNISILLIEAGGDQNKQWRVRHPMLRCPHLQNTDVDWAFRTEPQPLQQDRQSYWPRGKVLGGSSCLNFMLAVRGDPRGFDQWNLPGWKFTDVEPYYQRLENYVGNHSLPRRGKRGPITVEDNRDRQYPTKSLVEAFIQGCVENNCPRTEDYNSPVLGILGVAEAQTTTKNCYRADTATSYLYGEDGAMNKCSNLNILCYAQVARVTFASQNGTPRTTGVELIDGTKIGARREVILCAGAVQSPHLLLLSGIGPKQHLEKFKIPLVVDSPGVGQNLKDHLMVGMTWEVANSFEGGFSDRNPLHIVSNLVNWFTHGSGLFSLPWVQAMAFKDSSFQKPNEQADIQIHLVPFVSSDDTLTTQNFGIDPKKHGSGLSGKDLPHRAITFLPSLLSPKSTGYIELRSSDPRQAPIIEPRYFSNPKDIDILVEAMMFCQDVANTMRKNGVLGEPVLDKNNPHPPGSKEYLRHRALRDVVTIYHPTSTVRMGLDSNCPLDLQLRVKGVSGLRVADCSSFPDMIAGNTNLAAIMIGEKAADLVLGEFRKGI